MKWLLIALNIIGFLTLPSYYGSQLKQTNPLLWVFVPDCQLAVLFFAVSLIVKSDFFKALGVLSSIKYGLWTVIVLMLNHSYFANFWWLFIPHLFMVIQAAPFFKQVKFVPSVFSFLLMNDLSDYLYNTHPFIPANVSLIAFITFLITFSLMLLVVLSRKSLAAK